MPQHGGKVDVRMLPRGFLRRDYPDEPMRGLPMQSSRDKSPRARGHEILELDVRAARAGLYGVEPAAQYVCMIR